MEIHQLRYFVAVAQTRNFSRAAERCRVAQPSLSQQIKKLELELGERLFDRGPPAVTLTAAGEALAEHAERVLQEVELARTKVRDAGKELRGRVSLGALPTVAPYLLPVMLRAFGEENPNVEVVAHEDTTARLVLALERQELDLALTSLPIGSFQLAETVLFEEELVLAVPLGHRLAAKRSITAEDLERESFILMQEGHCLGGQALQFCESRGFAPRVSFRSAQVETMLAMVRAGLGVSLVPTMAKSATRGGVAFRRFSRQRPVRQIALLVHRRRTLSRAAEALAGFIRQQAADVRKR
jgi:LysR family transcriptional regulator, hydrogen peroxide-inducible genes activator